MSSKQSFSLFRRLIVAVRAWSFTTTFTPVLIVMSVLRNRLGLDLPSYSVCIALVVAMVAVQAIANLVNSYFDFRKGLDRTNTVGGDRTLVDQIISPSALWSMVAVLASGWIAFNLWSFLLLGADWRLILTAVAGTIMSVAYSAGPTPLKYYGLGDLCILACFGPLLAIYSCIILVQAVPVEAFVMACPAALYTVAILHANNCRDRKSDAEAGILTLAITLGETWSFRYYDALVLGAHISSIVVGCWLGCYGSLLTLLVLPRTLYLQWRIRQADRSLIETQDEATAQTQLFFGLAMALGIFMVPNTSLIALS